MNNEECVNLDLSDDTTFMVDDLAKRSLELFGRQMTEQEVIEFCIGRMYMAYVLPAQGTLH
jgi:hypothetical protein